jgi:hypothetical protein
MELGHVDFNSDLTSTDGERARSTQVLLLLVKLVLCSSWILISTGELCQKGYSRITEFEAHESSYDHQHKKVRHLIVRFR